jgi:phage shock protein PspC (stress-responsive transcriptional regulator)
VIDALVTLAENRIFKYGYSLFVFNGCERFRLGAQMIAGALLKLGKLYNIDADNIRLAITFTMLIGISSSWYEVSISLNVMKFILISC